VPTPFEFYVAPAAFGF